MPYGKKYSGHMPFGKGSGKCNSTLCHMARSIPGTCLLARARGNATVLHTLCHFACFCFKKMPIRSATDIVYYSLQDNPANICMQEKRRLARHHQHKASLVEEELRLDNPVITYAQPTPPPATPPPPESPSLPPPPEANCAVRRLGIGDQQSTESTQQGVPYCKGR
jgi:hypothetical protein